MHVSLTSKYGSRVLLATYSFDLHRYLIKKSNHNTELLSTEATFGFCLLTFLFMCYSKCFVCIFYLLHVSLFCCKHVRLSCVLLTYLADSEAYMCQMYVIFTALVCEIN